MRLRHDIKTRLTRAVRGPREDRAWLGVSAAERIIVEMFDDDVAITGVAGGATGLPAAFQLLIKAKPHGERDTSPLIDDGAGDDLILEAAEWDADEGTNGALVCETANTLNDAVYALLGLGNDDADDDIREELCELELSYRAASANEWQKGRPLEFDLIASVNLADDATPTPIGTSRGPRFYPDITGLTGGGTTKLDGIVTVGVAVPIVVVVYVSSELQFWRLATGTTAESSPSVIRPDDYNATTNAKVWTRVL